MGRIEINKMYNKLKPIDCIGKDKYYRKIYRCECICGNETTATDNSLLYNHKISCGCIRGRTKHNLSRSRIYEIWQQMIQRCYKESCQNYYKYGEKGIIICDEWRNKENGFSNFYDWSMKNGYILHNQ